ncbi:hypothetical protein [Sorangium sp. So ce854]|uniref:hypothetical protein n=1 Tax=Sorangium sp. So ce854 TaxID=3133322 RepID=UPI003F631AF9
MGTSPKPTIWIGLGLIAVAALAAAYNLGRTSAEGGSRHQRQQGAASKNDPDLRSALSTARKRLASCEETLQRHDQHLQQREDTLHTNGDESTPSPAPALPKECTIASQVKELQMLAANCRGLRRHFDAYKAILGSNTISCEIVLDVLSVAHVQSSFCATIIRANEGTVYRDAMSDPLAIAATEDAYATRNECGNPDDLRALVKNPECIAQLRTE